MEHVNGNGARALLEKPFDPDLIKTRPGSHGQSLSYVESWRYIERLNQAYGDHWSFEIAGHEVGSDEVIVAGKLITPTCTKMAFGSSALTRRKDTGEVVDLGDTMKAAASDALKKACTLLGLGLHMYDNDSKDAAGNGNGTAKSNGHSNGNDPSGGDDKSRLTSRQLSAIVSIGAERGVDRDALQQTALARFGRKLEFLSRAEASAFIDELKKS